MAMIATAPADQGDWIIGFLLIGWLLAGAWAFLDGMLLKRPWTALLGAGMWGLFLTAVYFRQGG